MKRGVSQRRREQQSGFILLVVFLMAAMIAMMLYQQLPRVAFESERDKEQLLIERGEQYVRAIQLFTQDNQKLPASLDELEKTNNKRYLRKRYKDPYTGKEEWRLIHATGPGGQLTDSKGQKPADPNASSSTSSSSSSSSTSNSQTGNSQPGDQQVNAAVNLRPSDVTLPGAQSFQGPLPGSQQQQQPGQVPFAPSPNQGMNAPPSVSQTAQPGFGLPGQGLPQGIALPGGIQSNGTAGSQGQQGQQGQGQNGQQGFTPQFPGQQFPGQAAPAGFQPQFPGQQFPGQLPPAGTQTQQQQTQTMPNGQPVPVGFQLGPNGQLVPAPVGANAGGMPQVSVAGTPGTPTLPGGNQGVNIIQQILTTPRTAPTSGTQQNSGVGGGGIAGVASMHEGPSIAVYKERQKYQEWEFIYTPQQNGAAGAINTGGATPGSNPPGSRPPGGNPPGGNPPGGRPPGSIPSGGNPPGGFTPSSLGQGTFGTSGNGSSKR